MEKDVVVTSMPLYEVKLYLGSVDSVHDDDNRISRLTWEKETLVASIGVFQEIYKGTTIPVRITNTTFVSDGYVEDGWEIAAISYPRTNHTHKQTLDFMLDLAEHLLERFGQNRVCVLDLRSHHQMFGKTYMIERGGSE